jgi:hypothetical protein
VRKQAVGVLALLFSLVTGAAAYGAAPGAFQQVGNLTTPRFNPTTTLLNDGTVLVTGGWKRMGVDFSGDLEPQATAERFDPATNTFSAVGSMAFPRARHVAVRLQDGRVLVVGGSSEAPALDGPPPSAFVRTAELFDPATGKFSPTGDLLTPRLYATATLLPNGKVLVVGGWNQNTVETAELYDPASGTFGRPAGPMIRARNVHEAVSLPDGRVVLLGGAHFNDGPQRSVEIYDPQTNTFSAAGQMVEGRAGFSATLLPDGRILVTGGAGGPGTPTGQGTTILNSVEIYDPATGQSTITDHTADVRFDHGAVALADGRVLVMGGYTSLDNSGPLASAVLIDPATGKVSPAGPMVGPRGYAVPTLLPDGRVLVIGGRPRVLVAEVYVP